MASASPAARRKRAVESYRSASECIGTIEPGHSVFAITRGQWSMIDAALACLDQSGPAHLSLWTWAVADYEVECVERLRKDGRLLSGSLVVDVGMRNKSKEGPIILDRWRSTFGPESVRFVSCHAKIVTIESERFRLLLRGSMNLNFNPRFEQFDMTEGGDDFELVRRIQSELPILPPDASRPQANWATGVGNAFDADRLQMFGGLKSWQKQT